MTRVSSVQLKLINEYADAKNISDEKWMGSIIKRWYEYTHIRLTEIEQTKYDLMELELLKTFKEKNNIPTKNVEFVINRKKENLIRCSKIKILKLVICS